MKQFLFDKFNSFTSEVETTSLVRFTKNLPGTLHLDPGAITLKGFPNWGWEPNGFWTLTRDEARFFEDDGTIHCIGKQYDNHYCESHRSFTSHLTGIRSLLLMETDNFNITTNDHVSCSFNDEVFYVKFVSPSGEFGIPITDSVMIGDLEAGTDTYKMVTDLSCKVYEGFKAAGTLAPDEYTPKIFIKDSQGYYVGIVPDFSVSINQSIDNTLARGQRPSDDRYDVNEILEYGVQKWLALKT